MKRRRGNPGVILGAGVLASTVLLFGAVLVRAMGHSPMPSSPLTSEAEAAPAQEAAAAEGPAKTAVVAEAGEPTSSAVPSDVLARAIERAPFDPNRQPAEPYLLPDERVLPPPPPRRTEQPAPPAFRVLGTVSGPGGNVAVMSVEDGPPIVMALGQEMNGYRISDVGDARVTLSGQGRTVTVQVADAQPTAARERNGRNRENGNNGRNQPANSRNQSSSAQRERAEAAAVAARQALERAAAAGGRVQIQNGTATVTLPDGRTIQMPAAGAGGNAIFQFNSNGQGGTIVRPSAPGGTTGRGGRGGGGGGGGGF